ncbi:tetratricopeptide repeat protein [Aquabacter sp. L1I39]|uniref:tetratricopeptide repeat protein n=1 Tax=Aquabacter sp. L1I39 TaxID=2820278 RepID=UPI001ADA2B99|nr:tetratricopeptide repeat protein [Aquabacter sp. L1I39]QTL04593.1 tetratricopeptide repeat protein [Aquabacter sp. L1I39]
MTDIFHEIEEDLRRDRLRRVWDRYGIVFIALVVLVIAGAAGYSGYKWWALQQDQASGARFEAAAHLAAEGKATDAEAAYVALSKDGTAGYRMLARFRAAAEIATTDKAKGAAAFDAIAADSSLSSLTRDLARVRAGLLLVDTAPLAEIQSRLQALADSQSALRFSAREILALAQYKAGDLAAANKAAALLLEEPEVPPGVRNRAELIRALTAAAAQINPAVGAAATQ